MKYEYLIEQTGTAIGLTEMLSSRSEEGWEVLDFTMTGTGGDTTYAALLQRIIPVSTPQETLALATELDQLGVAGNSNAPAPGVG